MSDALSRFEAKWLALLDRRAESKFHHTLTPAVTGLHSAVADTFVSQLGYQSIGFNWELVDAHGLAESPRSASGEITRALSHDISNPSRTWLDQGQARECANDLLGAFDRQTLTIVSNRYDGLWNPISGAAVEWAFVCFDDSAIALLLLVARD